MGANLLSRQISKQFNTSYLSTRPKETLYGAPVVIDSTLDIREARAVYRNNVYHVLAG